MHWSTIILLLLPLGYPAISELVYPCDGIDPLRRDDCGYYGIQKEECMHRGCCWDDIIQKVPWCFRNREECGVKAQDRTDCGWFGINKAECNKRGCCWDDKTKKAQFCFYPKSHKCYGILPDKRKDCGYFGIQRDECEKDRGCCFDHTVEGASWCFTGRYMPPPQMFTSQTPSPLSRASSTEGSGAPPTTEGEPIQDF
ncbi:hypothetical protein ABFA07_014865 [Porites harrisoni]